MVNPINGDGASIPPKKPNKQKIDPTKFSDMVEAAQRTQQEQSNVVQGAANVPQIFATPKPNIRRTNNKKGKPGSNR
ncbi:hypothetical protein [Ruegeria arenilitoris]|uniref:hypothetical protein n=1 Tax=Ruegeria arenilitoris TaxID=1173585 RepID=UPI00147A3D0A|nr:hypothetical protein [Ruegeria arenilitoris]